MLRKNIILAFRLILKNRNVSIINIIGLSFSLACALFILLWVRHEMSYDRFHPDYKNVCRVEEDQYYSNPEAYHVNVTPNPSGPVWMDEIPEIIDQCRVAWAGGILLTNGDIKFFENDVVSVDSSYFNMFGFKLLEGSPESVLNEPNSIVISEEIAKKYFGDERAAGKTLKVDNDKLFTVTGVMENPPKNTVLPANILLSWDYHKGKQRYSDSWGNNSIFTYVRLFPGSADSVVNRKLTEVTDLHKENNTIDYMVDPIHRIHLHSYFGFGKSPGAIVYVYIFCAVALFVLIIACINFMNMSTANSSLRAKEIGLRKVSGASRKLLMSQYISESVLMAFISIILAFLLVIVLLNPFNDLAGKDIALKTLFSPGYLLGILVVGVFTGIISGLYPAFYLSSFNPARAIKENSDSRKGSGLLRKGLVVFQFSLSILLISGSIVIARQLTYMRNADLGFNKYHLVNIPLKGGLGQYYPSLKTEFMKDPRIEYISASIQEPYNIGSNSSSIHWPGKDEEMEVLVSFSGVDFDFCSTMGINLLDGRDFSEEYQADVLNDTLANFLINKTLADIINKDEIIGMDMTFSGLHGTVVGVMDDFHFKPLKDEVEPLAVVPLPPEYFSTMVVRLKTEDLSPALKDMEAKWNSMVSQFPFEYSFVDEEIDNMYHAEERMAKLIGLFSIVAVVIACMGLFALASFTATRRTREIGIRKTFGASDRTIVKLMIFDFMKLVAISILIGLPAVWLLSVRWLSDFSYRISLKPDIFIIAAVLTILVSGLTILYHAIRYSRLNPVIALRYE